jgi:toxin ParE1/3/4
MLRVSYSPEAEEDLYKITVYTIRHWSETQAERYLDLLTEAAERLLTEPWRGRPCPRILPDLFRCEAGSHVLFYLRTDDGITVSRVLHKRQHAKRHFR